MTSLFRNTFVFVIGYVILMIPTYLLPWLGSNSAVLNAVGVAVGHGMTPLWWAHAWCLVMLILMTWIRGDIIGKKYLPIFPFMAAVFDLTPGLSMIPLIPTALHLVAIIIGVKAADQQPIADGVEMPSGWSSASRKAGILAGMMTAVAIFGSVLFMSTSNKSLSEFEEQKSGVPVKRLPTKSESPPVSVHPEKVGAPPANLTDSGNRSHTAAVKPQQVKKVESNSDQNTVKDVAKVRYINLNE